jgi:methionyl-tRNA formyltransferase
VFFGTSEFALPSLRALHERFDVARVVTQPDRPRGRGLKLMPSPVKAEAQALGIPTSEPLRLRDAAARLADEGADAFALVSYGKIVPQAILDVPPWGAFNVHPSLLPLYRGATPLQSALRDGRRESGVSVILMDAGMDTGDLVLQERSAIGERETYGALHDRFAALGAEMLARAIAAAAGGTLVRTPQAELNVPAAEIAATATHPLRPEDLVVAWTWPARRIVDSIRSLAPAPLARARFDGRGETVKIAAARETDEAPRERPGFAWAAGDVAFVTCGDGVVALERVVPPNRSAMSAGAYLRIAAPGS